MHNIAAERYCRTKYINGTVFEVTFKVKAWTMDLQLYPPLEQG